MSGFNALPPAFGRYEPVAELGQGAMGRVYAATDPLIERMVAIKTIPSRPAGTGRARGVPGAFPCRGACRGPLRPPRHRRHP